MRSTRHRLALFSSLAWRLFVAIPVVAAPPSPSSSSPAAFSSDFLRAAQRALDEGLPTAAIPRLRQFLESGGGDNLPPTERRTAGLLLARALLGTGDARGALDVLSSSVVASSGDDDHVSDVAFLRAGAHAALGRWEAALADYARAGNGPAARFGRAECLRALGRGVEADRLLAELAGGAGFASAAALRRAELALDAGRPADAEARLRETPAAAATATGRFLLARARLDAGRPAEAEPILIALVAGGPEGFTPPLLVRTYLALAQARGAQGRPAEAVAGLENFAERYPRNPQLGEVFAALERFRGREASVVPGRDATLARWQKDAAEPLRAGFAALVLARARRAAGWTEDARTILDEFPARFPGHPWGARAGAERVSLLLATGRPAEARAALASVRALPPGGDVPDLRATLDGLEVRASLALGDYPAAAARLEALAASPNLPPARVESALAAAALARLRAGDENGFRTGRAALEQRFPTGNWYDFLPLEEGLLRATAGDEAGAIAVLRAFLAGNLAPNAAAPDTKAAARLALAELRFQNGDDLDAVRADLRRVANANPAPPEDIAARAELLAILAADAPGEGPGTGGGRDENAAVARARAFLARRPDSPLAAEVRLKLGEIYYRREDYPDAETELELVPATAAPNLYEAARYLAGLAALGGQSPTGADRAVELFEDAAKLNGPLKTAARLRQAETLRDRLGKPADALVLYDAILAATVPPPDAGTRCAALVGKAEATLRLATAAPSPGDRAATRAAEEAARLFAQAAQVPGASLAWRRQALARQGAALERTGEPGTAAAVSAYVAALDAAVVTADHGGDGGEEDDLTWFYRAGFAAARLLRDAGQWRQAIAVYERLARADGPLRAEAEGQARALRLEHFVWNDEGEMKE